MQDLQEEMERHKEMFLSLDQTGRQLVSGLTSQEDASLLRRSVLNKIVLRTVVLRAHQPGDSWPQDASPEKAMVTASVWGPEFFSVPCRSNYMYCTRRIGRVYP